MRTIAPSLILLASITISLPCAATYVKGYYRKDGTYVAPHYRRSPTHSGSTTSYSGATYSGTTPSYDATIPSRPFVTQSPQATTPQEPCAWVDADGTPCKRSANPGYKYCYRHVGLTPPSAAHVNVTKADVDSKAASSLSLDEISIAHGIPLSVPQVSETPKPKWRKQNLTLTVSAFFAMMFLSCFGFAVFSRCSVHNKIVRTLLTIPGVLGVSLLFYWYVPVRQHQSQSHQASDKALPSCKTWSWSAAPQSRLLFVCSRERIKGDCVQLVLNGKTKCYAGIAFPRWLTVPSKQTVPVAVKFDDNDPIEDPWISAKDGGGIFAPWPNKDFIEAAEESKDFGITFKDVAGAFYTFTFDIRKLRATLGPDRKYFIGD